MTPPTWRKSNYSGTEGDCVEVANLDVVVGVRDSKDPEGGRLSLDRTAFGGLLARVKAGDLDL
ncbi:DUF397 domain-containing protein [Actinomadura xylanilytica]|uniref:DUF397 domain-containing protein n=1 Tax=Actinomadura xylanilytica TaxID=887459 RepID=UPI00255A9568|nr:DUF397 domain-containing protein [Actinomadura xylanilytica]MDL4775317.1 DUF397 domain-containing protein [Actinomadura xylanilytica]